jgi:hypothetical protein
MKLAMWLLILSSLAYAAPCPTTQEKNGDALAKAELAWARSLEQSDTAALGCILAAEFEDAGPDGKLTDRATTLVKAGEHRAVRHELTNMRADVHDDFGYIRGLATAMNAEGKVLAIVRFTDVYVYREGRWQCVAGHESMLTEASH